MVVTFPTIRTKIIVFRGAYHGGVIKFPQGDSPLNIPFDYVLADYNDTEGTAALIDALGGELAAVIVEPILGAGGNIPGDRAFMEMLRKATREVGALLIFDEVMTGFRVAYGGAQSLQGMTPDITTLGKIVGGGLPLAAYGGRAEIMDHVLPAGGVFQAGTLSGNPLATAVGAEVLDAVLEDGFLEAVRQKAGRLRQALARLQDEHPDAIEDSTLSGSVFAWSSASPSAAAEKISICSISW